MSFHKFTGIGISIFKNGKIEYKLYGKSGTNEIYNYLKKTKTGFQEKLVKKYGDVVLASQRISYKTIKGYNLYYIK